MRVSREFIFAVPRFACRGLFLRVGTAGRVSATVRCCGGCGGTATRTPNRTTPQPFAIPDPLAVHVRVFIHARELIGKTYFIAWCLASVQSLMINGVCGRFASNFSTVFCRKDKKALDVEKFKKLANPMSETLTLIIALCLRLSARANKRLFIRCPAPALAPFRYVGRTNGRTYF